MVRTEDRDTRIGMAREGRGMPIAHSSGSVGAASSYEDVYNKEESGPRMRERIEKTEKEIVRLTMIAEKDKRESIACTNKIKKLKEQLQELASSQGEEIRRSYSENDLVAQYAEKFSCSMSPPPSSLPTFRLPLPNSSLRYDAENKSPNISPNLSPLPDELSKLIQESAKLDKLLAAKEDELLRVKQRAKEESARAAALRSEEEELKKAVANESEVRMRANQDMKVAIARKEKEIIRLTMLAERDKRTGMFMRDQLESQKKTLSAFANVCTDKRPELLRVLNSCDDIVIPSSPSPALTVSSYGSSSSSCVTPLSLTPQSPSNLLARSRSCSSPCSSPLRQEADKLLRADICKEEELYRVIAIADVEASRASILKTKAEEIKKIIAKELQEVNEALEHKLRMIRNQQDAIHKVVARAELERAKACALQEELNRLSKKLCGDKGEPNPLGTKKSEYLPDKAYLSEFKELSVLIPVSDLNTANDPIANPSKDDMHSHAHTLPHSPSSQCTCVDPITFIQSPPTKQVALCESEMVYAQKLQDLVTLDREVARMDDELVRAKRLKEAEIARRRLLSEKVKDLQVYLD